jgi:hypothetical protein
MLEDQDSRDNMRVVICDGEYGPADLACLNNLKKIKKIELDPHPRRVRFLFL